MRVDTAKVNKIFCYRIFWMVVLYCDNKIQDKSNPFFILMYLYLCKMSKYYNNTVYIYFMQKFYSLQKNQIFNNMSYQYENCSYPLKSIFNSHLTMLFKITIKINRIKFQNQYLAHMTFCSSDQEYEVYLMKK